MQVDLLDADQKELIAKTLQGLHLSDKTEVVELTIEGKASALDILSLVQHAWRVGYRSGVSAAVKAHSYRQECKDLSKANAELKVENEEMKVQLSERDLI